MVTPSHDFVSGVKRETDRESAIAHFLSPAFIAPYGPDAWRWFPAVVRPPMPPGELRAAMLNAATYLDVALDAQVEGDDEAVRSAVEVLAAIVQVVAGQLPGASVKRAVH